MTVLSMISIFILEKQLIQQKIFFNLFRIKSGDENVATIIRSDHERKKNYSIYFDNFFTSSDLILHLKKIGLSATGTVRQNRVKINVDLPKKCDRGTTTSVHDKSSKINHVTVMDSKPVSILSTDYGDENKVTMSR